mmetsp:Transcript_26143/g.57615  ORF Transcript_26143/g.57615 Transcript_26143/m.57615 type:complete len:657 (-) Transcript_26143:110-2080(-)
MGESCSRLASCAVIEDCQPGETQTFLEECAGGPPRQKGKLPPAGIGLSAFGRQSIEVGLPLDVGVELTTSAFMVCQNGSYDKRAEDEIGSGPVLAQQTWRQMYRIGKDIGSGQTAVVYLGYMQDPARRLAVPLKPNNIVADVETTESPRSGADRQSGRPVAVKVFHQANSVMFQQEQQAFLRVGVHPHVLRLLESYQGFGDKDVLIMEYCEGGDVYDLYARAGGNPIAEAYVALLLRQLLLALEHLERVGVEHRDVKPENLLLCGHKEVKGGEAPRAKLRSEPLGHPMNVPHVKLADFGWSISISASKQWPPLPPDGVGSLWYAPPELNPPVPGVKPQAHAQLVAGRSDMWSCGVIAYLLLVGHNPFNLALRFKDSKMKEAEVLRLAARGDVNQSARGWSLLSGDAQGFIRSLVQPDATVRNSAMEALSHPFIKGNTGKLAQNAPPHPALMRSNCWERLEGLQRLAWLAVARAATEAELLAQDGFELLLDELDIQCSRYLDQVAAELVSVACPDWFQPGSAWTHIFLLAFRYLDVDCDGRLNLEDVVAHIQDGTSPELVSSWIARWHRRLRDSEADHNFLGESVGYGGFREVLKSVLDPGDSDDIWLEHSNEQQAKERFRDIFEHGCAMFMHAEEEESRATMMLDDVGPAIIHGAI